MSIQHRIILITLLALVYGSHPSAATETEPNDTFATRTVLAPGVLEVSGSLDRFIDPADADFVFTGTLVSGMLTPHTLGGQTPGALFFGALDNTSRIDTLLGTVDESGVLLDFDDDGSPFGDGLADALNGSVNADGSIRFQVTGFPDDTFSGAHEQAGSYELYVYLDTFFAADVDFLSFSGLTPGELVRVRIASADFDPVLGLYSAIGEPLAVNDDFDGSLLSQLTVTVPGDGMLQLAVSAYPDFGFVGDHGDAGNYSLVIESVPLPAAWLLFAPALAVFLRPRGRCAGGGKL